MIRIAKGNNFWLKIRVEKITMTNSGKTTSDYNLEDLTITSIKVYSGIGSIDINYTVSNSVLSLFGESTYALGIYAFEIIAKDALNNDLRYYEKELFQIVDETKHADVPADTKNDFLVYNLGVLAIYAGALGGSDLSGFLSEIKGMFLSKENDDTAQGHITFAKGLTSNGVAKFNKDVYTKDIDNSGKIITKDLEVSGTAHFYEVVIDKCRATNSIEFQSPASAKVDIVEALEGNRYKVYFLAEDEDGKAITNDFVVGDQIYMQMFNLGAGTYYNTGNRFYWVYCEEVSYATTTIEDKSYWSITLDFNRCANNINATPKPFDEITVLGNQLASQKDRQNTILFASVDNSFLGLRRPDALKVDGVDTYPSLKAPMMVQLNGIDDFKIKHPFYDNGESNYGNIISHGYNSFRGVLHSSSSDQDDVVVRVEDTSKEEIKYKCTSSFSKPSAEEDGWEDEPSPSTTLPYIWKRRHVYYTNNTEDYLVEYVNYFQKGTDGTSIKFDGELWTEKLVADNGGSLPKLYAVRFYNKVYIVINPDGTANPPIWCYTDKNGNRLRYNDGGYVLAQGADGNIIENTDDWEAMSQFGADGKDGYTPVKGKDYSDGVAVKSINIFKRGNVSQMTVPTGGTFDAPIPTSEGWSDGVPSGEEKVWMSTRIFYSTGVSTSWSTPAPMTDTADFDVCYSADETDPSAYLPTQGSNINNEHWHNQGTSNDKWMATASCRNGEWSNWTVTQILGEEGKPSYIHTAWCNDITTYADFKTENASGEEFNYLGTYTDDQEADSQTPSDYEWIFVHGADGEEGLGVKYVNVFKRSNASTMTKPTGGTYDKPIPQGWSDGVPSGKEQCWISTRTYYSDGRLTTWSDPAVMTDTADFDCCFSKSTTKPSAPTSHGTQNDSTWHNTPQEGDIWMATSVCKNGEWGTWQITRILGEQGDPSYIHTAWCNNITTWEGFTISNPNGAKYNYIGTYTDHTKADSTDKTKYNWVCVKGADATDMNLRGEWTEGMTLNYMDAVRFEGVTYLYVSKTAWSGYPRDKYLASNGDILRYKDGGLIWVTDGKKPLFATDARWQVLMQDGITIKASSQFEVAKIIGKTTQKNFTFEKQQSVEVMLVRGNSHISNGVDFSIKSKGFDSSTPPTLTKSGSIGVITITPSHKLETQKVEGYDYWLPVSDISIEVLAKYEGQTYSVVLPIQIDYSSRWSEFVQTDEQFKSELNAVNVWQGGYASAQSLFEQQTEYADGKVSGAINTLRAEYQDADKVVDGKVTKVSSDLVQTAKKVDDNYTALTKLQSDVSSNGEKATSALTLIATEETRAKKAEADLTTSITSQGETITAGFNAQATKNTQYENAQASMQSTINGHTASIATSVKKNLTTNKIESEIILTSDCVTIDCNNFKVTKSGDVSIAGKVTATQYQSKFHDTWQDDYDVETLIDSVVIDITGYRGTFILPKLNDDKACMEITVILRNIPFYDKRTSIRTQGRDRMYFASSTSSVASTIASVIQVLEPAIYKFQGLFRNFLGNSMGVWYISKIPFAKQTDFDILSDEDQAETTQPTELNTIGSVIGNNQINVNDDIEDYTLAYIDSNSNILYNFTKIDI